MKSSRDRILTTHVGSLPRPDDLLELVLAKEEGRPVDDAALDARVRDAVREVVRRQAELGLDIVNDGEYSKPSFITYVNERLTGFERRAGEPSRNQWRDSKEFRAFPKYYEAVAAASERRSGTSRREALVCTGPITYRGQAQLERDLRNLKQALEGVRVEEAFVTAIAPIDIEHWHRNEYYPTQEAYALAIAEAMRTEYLAIVEAGFILQIDDPRLLTQYTREPDWTVADCRKWAESRVEILNHALRGIPEDRIRYHTCYGINIGPRVHDMELKDMVDIILKVRAGAYSFEWANPRHAHEWRVWREVKLPEHKLLIPGFITQSSVLVEHPEVVAEGIMRFANVVGRERVIAGADCGFATFAASREIAEEIVWAKFRSLVEGARLASRRLWGRG
ncbi:MAG TPA: cobalamin-independent methionine synthase II family protein [Bacillota bacterium]